MNYNQWLKNFKSWYEGQTASTALAVVFPIYRPDLVADLAAKMSLRLVDYRKLYMQPLGWEAAKLPLSHMSEIVQTEMGEGKGVVLQNFEALLALHTEAERREWLAQSLEQVWPQRLVLPMALYAHDLPRTSQQIYTFLDFDLPEETLLDRLNTFS